MGDGPIALAITRDGNRARARVRWSLNDELLVLLGSQVKYHSGVSAKEGYETFDAWFGYGTIAFQRHVYETPKSRGRKNPNIPSSPPPRWAFRVEPRRPDHGYPMLGLWTYRFIDHDE